jgi:hypothetical protein
MAGVTVETWIGKNRAKLKLARGLLPQPSSEGSLSRCACKNRLVVGLKAQFLTQA